MRAGIDTPPWELEWFIAPYTSNHQQGYAVDLSLVKILEKRETVIKGRTVVKAEKVEEYAMQDAVSRTQHGICSIRTSVSVR